MSIDRRSFVQTAAAAVGGAAGFSGDAVAQDRIQLAQATIVGPFSYPSPPAGGGGPFKPYNPDAVGDQVQRHGVVLKDLFDLVKGPQLRKEIWEANDTYLRNWIKDKYAYVLDPSIRIIIVDIQNGRVRFSDGNGCTAAATNGVGGECSITARGDDPMTTYWYTLVIPPQPLQFGTSGTPDDGYVHEMTWDSAWHHAIVYGYGM
jgi:hypothetical protein